MDRHDKLAAIMSCCLEHPYCNNTPPCPLHNEHYQGYGCCDESLPDDILDKLYSKVVNGVEDKVEHPNHYTHGGLECIDEMIAIFGRKAVANFCLCNVWKYRKRALHKNGQEDLDKSDWYIKKYIELKQEVQHNA